MKKSVWAKMLSFALVLVCVMGLAACGGGGDTSAAGTYKLQTIEMAGMTMDLPQLAEAAGVSEDELKLNLELKEDGTFVLDMAALQQADMSMEGTWEQSGSNIKLTAEGSTTSATLKDGVITIADDSAGISMTFKK